MDPDGGTVKADGAFLGRQAIEITGGVPQALADTTAVGASMVNLSASGDHLPIGFDYQTRAYRERWRFTAWGEAVHLDAPAHAARLAA